MSEPPVPDRRFTFMVVPEGGRGDVKQVTLTLKQVRRVLVGMSVLLVAAVFGGAGLVRAAWHSRANQRLLDENIALKSEIGAIEARLDEVDAILRRLRLYDAQLEGLPDDFGPLEADEIEVAGQDAVSAWLATLDIPMEEGAEDPGVADLSDAEVWARDVAARGERTQQMLTLLEPYLGSLAERGEELRARLASMPREWPVPGGVLTSTFGYRRSPFTRRWKFHAGIDVASKWGAPVVATAGGRVIRVEYAGGYGRVVEIDHGYGTISRFAHNSKIFVQEGDVVERGQHIANVGTTGHTTGPHLHYEVDIDGVHVDPLEYLRPSREPGRKPSTAP